MPRSSRWRAAMCRVAENAGVAPAAGTKTTSCATVLVESTGSEVSVYVPAATSTVCPGAATRYARLSERQGAAWVQDALSEPDGAMYSRPVGAGVGVAVGVAVTVGVAVAVGVAVGVG